MSKKMFFISFCLGLNFLYCILIIIKKYNVKLNIVN